jgi:hypothetical protein
VPCAATASRNTETVERTHRILKEHESGPDPAKLRGSLEHAHVVARAAQPDRRRQSTDPCSHDDYPHRPIMPGRAALCERRVTRYRPGLCRPFSVVDVLGRDPHVGSGAVSYDRRG